MIRNWRLWWTPSSAVSKYRIETHYSVFRQRAVLAVHVLILLSVWLWQPDSFSYQQAVQWSLSLLCAVSLTRWLSRTPAERIFTVSEEGDWQWGLPGQTERLLAPQSRVTAWVLLICLQDKLSGSVAERLMLFRDQLSEQNYRRLCRIILRRQSNPKE